MAFHTLGVLRAEGGHGNPAIAAGAKGFLKGLVGLMEREGGLMIGGVVEGEARVQRAAGEAFDLAGAFHGLDGVGLHGVFMGFRHMFHEGFEIGVLL